MPKMIILSGLPASGKSTYAKELMAISPVYERINWDSIRHVEPGYKFARANEELVREKSFWLAREAARQGMNLIVDNTNLNDKAIGTWTRIASQLGMTVDLKVFDTPVEECIRRDALRTGWAQVGRVAIERMALVNGLIKFPEDRKVVIVDVDGTLADCGHRRRKKENGKTDWDYFYRPELIEADPAFPVVVEWTRELYKHYTVLIVSGRSDDKAGKQTVNWLAKNDVPYHHIFMRPGGDMRDDCIIKQEILDKILDKMPKSMISFCIDDRTRVVDMWRENGLTCYQIVSRDEGNF